MAADVMDAATSKAPVPLFTLVVVAHVPVAGAAGPAGTHVLELPDRSKGGTDPGVLATANDLSQQAAQLRSSVDRFLANVAA